MHPHKCLLRSRHGNHDKLQTGLKKLSKERPATLRRGMSNVCTWETEDLIIRTIERGREWESVPLVLVLERQLMETLKEA